MIDNLQLSVRSSSVAEVVDLGPVTRGQRPQLQRGSRLVRSSVFDVRRSMFSFSTPLSRPDLKLSLFTG